MLATGVGAIVGFALALWLPPAEIRWLQPVAVVPLLTATGCPYRCDFCVDAASTHRPLDPARLRVELRFIARRWPGRLVVFHDPNFSVRFAEVMGVLESLPPGERNPYAIQASLALLRPRRLQRLRDTGCAYVVPEVESWSACGDKAGTGALAGCAKLEAVVSHFAGIGYFIPNIQANFVLGTDADAGPEPWALTAELARRLPCVYPAVSIPAPYSGTAFFERVRRQRRLLEALPFACYGDPCLAFVPRHYDPVDYYAGLIGLMATVTDPRLWLRRLGAENHPLTKLVHSAQLLAARRGLGALRRIYHLLTVDPAFRRFHGGRGGDLPPFYCAAVARRLGRYAQLLSPEDLRPVLPAPGAGSEEFAA